MNSLLRTISLSILLAISLAMFAMPVAQARTGDSLPPITQLPAVVPPTSTGSQATSPPASTASPAAPATSTPPPAGAAAASTTGAPKITLKSWFIKNTDGSDMTLKQLIIRIIPNFLISFVGLVFIVFFLVSAVRYLIGAGNTESTTSAKQGMLSAIIGIIVVLVAFGAVNVVNNWIGS